MGELRSLDEAILKQNHAAETAAFLPFVFVLAQGDMTLPEARVKAAAQQKTVTGSLAGYRVRPRTVAYAHGLAYLAAGLASLPPSKAALNQ